MRLLSTDGLPVQIVKDHRSGFIGHPRIDIAIPATIRTES